MTEAPAVGQQPQCEAPRAFEGRGIEGSGGWGPVGELLRWPQLRAGGRKDGKERI